MAPSCAERRDEPAAENQECDLSAAKANTAAEQVTATRHCPGLMVFRHTQPAGAPALSRMQQFLGKGTDATDFLWRGTSWERTSSDVRASNSTAGDSRP